jgi:hypothetical protein
MRHGTGILKESLIILMPAAPSICKHISLGRILFVSSMVAGEYDCSWPKNRCLSNRPKNKVMIFSKILIET